MSRIKKYKIKRTGMTLIELIIVLGIIAAISTYALTSVGSLTDRTRFDRSNRTMQQLKIAIVGTETKVSRFVEDLGRLPYFYWQNEGEEFSELLENTENVDSWDGPYIQTGYTKFYDGFGNPFGVQLRYEQGDSWVVTPWLKRTSSDNWIDENNGVVFSFDENRKYEIVGIKSYGKNYSLDTNPTDWADEDLELACFDQMIASTLTVNVKILSALSAPQDPRWIAPEAFSSDQTFQMNSKIKIDDNWKKAQVGDYYIYIDSAKNIKIFNCILANDNLVDASFVTLPEWDSSASGNIVYAKNASEEIIMKWKHIPANSLKPEWLTESKCLLSKSNDSQIIELTQNPIAGSFNIDQTHKLTPGVWNLEIIGYLHVANDLKLMSVYSQTVKLHSGQNVINVYLNAPLVNE